MSAFDSIFAAYGQPTLDDRHGRSCTYNPAGDADSTTFTGLVSSDTVTEMTEADGRENERTRQVAIPISDVSAVAVNATLTIDSQTWAIRRIVTRSQTYTLVEVVRTTSAEKSRRGYRGGR